MFQYRSAWGLFITHAVCWNVKNASCRVFKYPTKWKKRQNIGEQACSQGQQSAEKEPWKGQFLLSQRRKKSNILRKLLLLHVAKAFIFMSNLFSCMNKCSFKIHYLMGWVCQKRQVEILSKWQISNLLSTVTCTCCFNSCLNTVQSGVKKLKIWYRIR